MKILPRLVPTILLVMLLYSCGGGGGTGARPVPTVGATYSEAVAEPLAVGAVRVAAAQSAQAEPTSGSVIQSEASIEDFTASVAGVFSGDSVVSRRSSGGRTDAYFRLENDTGEVYFLASFTEGARFEDGGDWLLRGIWLQGVAVADEGESPPIVAAYADGGLPYPVANIGLITETATYSSDLASGLFYDGRRTRYFDASVALTVDFGDAAGDRGNVWGAIMGLPEVGTLSLATASITGEAGGFFAGDTSASSGTYEGKWGGQFFYDPAESPSDSASPQPHHLAGTFGAATGTGQFNKWFLGTFETRREDNPWETFIRETPILESARAAAAYAEAAQATPTMTDDGVRQGSEVSVVVAGAPDAGTYVDETFFRHVVAPPAISAGTTTLDGDDLAAARRYGRRSHYFDHYMRSEGAEKDVHSVAETAYGSGYRTEGVDTDWRANGIWLEIGDDRSNVTVNLFANGGNPLRSDFDFNIMRITGTAEYTLGTAKGVFFDGSAVYRFEENVSLTADFGDAVDLGTVEGTVGIARDQSLSLRSANIGDTGFFTGDTSATFGGDTYSGRWGGQFYQYGCSTCTDKSDPENNYILGTFGASTGTDAGDKFVIGSFDAHNN